MTHSFYSNYATLPLGMKYSRYPVQSLNITNLLARSIEENILNVVGNVKSSQSAVVENAYGIL